MKKIIIVCNAIDDSVRSERNITTDSPAASRKVFMLADALVDVDTHVEIISMARGRANGSYAFYKKRIENFGNLRITYLPFTQVRGISEVLTFLYLAMATFLSATQRGYSSKAVIFYNRLPAYLLALLVSFVLGLRRIVDIEDGEVHSAEKNTLRKIVKSLIPRIYDFFCRDGALLACSELSSATKIAVTKCYYGTVDSIPPVHDVFTGDSISFLLSGSLSDETGAPRLIGAIRAMRANPSRWKNIKFDISGQGPSLQSFVELTDDEVFPLVKVHGRLSTSDYQTLLRSSDVGLALKPIGGALADTTFPSKVVEFANAGLLVVSTDISDVRLVLGDEGVVLLSTDSEEELVSGFDKILRNRTWAKNSARDGRRAVLEKLQPESVRKKIHNFIFPQP